MSKKKEESELVGELSTVCSHIVLKYLYLARIGRPDILRSLNRLARAITKWTKSCDKQTLGTFDLVHSSYKWMPAVVLCGRHSTTVQAWIVSRLWFCRRPWRLKISIRRNSVHFRKSHVCANKLDVQETDFSFTQFYRSWNHFSWCRFTHGRHSRSHFIPFRTEQMDPKESHGETRWQLSSQTCITPSQSNTPTSFQQTLIRFHQIQRILVPVLCYMSLRKMRQ